MSYTKPEEADAAISSMNGFFIGQKRLKVVRKRGQQTERYADSSNSATSARIDDPGFVGSVGGCTGNGNGNGNGSGNGSGSGNSNVEAGTPPDLDFLTPEGLLGQSMARRVNVMWSDNTQTIRVPSSWTHARGKTTSHVCFGRFSVLGKA